MASLFASSGTSEHVGNAAHFDIFQCRFEMEKRLYSEINWLRGHESPIPAGSSDQALCCRNHAHQPILRHQARLPISRMVLWFLENP
jgi:hypothetical protein